MFTLTRNLENVYIQVSFMLQFCELHINTYLSKSEQANITPGLHSGSIIYTLVIFHFSSVGLDSVRLYLLI